MNALNRKSIIATALLGIMMVAPGAIAGIQNTPHNLSSGSLSESAGGNNQPVNAMSATAEVCVFCHTPHGAATDNQAPLWNKTLPAASSYTVYDSARSSTIDGTVDLDGGVSMACLSCHDGTQAMDVMINTPGRNTDPGANVGTFAANSNSNAAGGAGTIGTNTSNVYANFSQDISNDHPVGIQYAGGGYEATVSNDTLVVAAGGLGDGDFVPPRTKMINSAPVWWLDTDGNIGANDGDNKRQKSDIQLFARDGATGYAGLEPFVECASCHDPHSSTTKTFLRVSNDGSRVCLACHDK